MFHYNDYLIPVWAICPLEYGPREYDSMQLSEEDIADLERFRVKLPAGAVLIYRDEREYFYSRSNDINSFWGLVAPAACYVPE